MNNFIRVSWYPRDAIFLFILLSVSASAELSYPHNVSFHLGIDHG